MAVGGTGPGIRSDVSVQSPETQVHAQSTNSLDFSESSDNNKLDNLQGKKDARMKTKDDERALTAMKSAEQKSFRRAKDLEIAAEKAAVLDGEKENDVMRTSLELAQCSLDLAKARTLITHWYEEETKRKKIEGRENRDVARIAQDLVQCKVELSKAQVVVAERDEEAFKMGKA
ncbi:hypothetical protein BGZ93_006092 [Podila epicladia]|nr:hypothetical protein BGZ93_006092 [Podila epicladia]